MADELDSGSSAHYGRAGSSPASRTKGKTLENTMFSRVLLHLWMVVFPYVFPLQNFTPAFSPECPL